MRAKWWKLAIGLAAIGGALLYNQLKSSKQQGDSVVSERPEGKNFGAFPPDLPDDMFEDATFV